MTKSMTIHPHPEAALVDWETVERVIGVEAGYIGWVVELDGVFENAAWRVMAVW